VAYDPNFIAGIPIELPTLSPSTAAGALNGGTPIEHEKFSVIFNEERGFAVLSANNLDGGDMIPAGTIKRRSFVLDPDVDSTIQVDNDRGYHKNRWDRGHLARRRSLHWGDVDKATDADRQSSYWTNIVPQHETLHDTAWGEVEDFMLELADGSRQRACVFTGPVLHPDDPEHRNKPAEEPIQIPAGFWKVIAVTVAGRLRAAGFLVWQRDFDKAEPVEFSPVLEQVRLTTIEYLAGLRFPDVLHVADPLELASATPVDGQPVGAAARPASPGPPGTPVPPPVPGPPLRSIAITNPADIYLG
jgi:endonuclease G